MSTSFFRDMLQTITDRGRRLLASASREQEWGKSKTTLELCEMLLSSHGEASGVAIAHDILARWEMFDAEEQFDFMILLLNRFGADETRLERAIDAYREGPTPQNLNELHEAAEPRRQELVRRLNLAPKGIEALVSMRESLLRLKAREPELQVVDADFAHLLGSWFNRGFLVLRPIDWSTPANILEKVIQYEAVHQINSWDELRSRLVPEDRRCFAFFHPQLADEPLIFVEVALTRDIPSSISEVLEQDRSLLPADAATTAVFYSISNCQEGLRGISFGNFLIKQVVEELRKEFSGLETFVTLSPAPAFAQWLMHERHAAHSEILTDDDRKRLEVLDNSDWSGNAENVEAVRPTLMTAAAWYFIKGRTRHGKVADPVARFHLGNGARLMRINFLGDRSARALSQAHGLMVNYLYKLDDIETNHEAFATRGEVATVPALQRPMKDREARNSHPKSAIPAEAPVG